MILPQFPEISLKDLSTIVDNYKKYDSWLENPYISEDIYNNLENIMKDASLIETDVPYNALVNNLYND